MAPGAGDFDGTLGGLLSANVLEVHQKFLVLAQQGVAIGLEGDDSVAGVHKVDHVQQRTHRVYIDSADHGGFAGVGFGDDEAGNLAAASLEGDGERSTNAANAAIERKLPDEQTVGDFLPGK